MDKTTVTKIDDLDQTTKAEATVKFSLDGKNYEIDLSKKNNAKIRRIFDPYIKAGRKVKRAGRPRKNAS